METLAGFAERLRELRKQKDLSHSELGERAEVHYTHIGRYERGVSQAVVKRFLDAFLTKKQIQELAAR